MSGDVAAGPILWKDCKQCGTPFVQERKRGRPKVTCSDHCREARGAHGDVRLTRGASYGTGVTLVIRSERHSTHDPTGAILADLFGGTYAPDGGGFVSERKVKRALDRALAKERAEAGEGVCTTDLYGLEAARDEGRTCPRVTRVIGQSLAWNWQESAAA